MHISRFAFKQKTLILLLAWGFLLPFILINEVRAQYCTPSASFSACAFGLNDFWITSVSFTGTGSTFNYTGGTCVSTAPYYLNTGYTGDVVAGNTYTLTLRRAGQTYLTYFNAWVDWNNNNVLNDATERIATNLPLAAGGGLNATVSVTIPAGASPGIHRMRVRCQYNLTNANNPCLTTGQAESKDFNLNVLSACTNPATQASAGSVSGITMTTADISWTGGSGTGGDIVFLKQGSAIATDPSNTVTYVANAAFGSGSQIGTTGAYAVYSGFGGAVTVTNLLPGTTYYYSIYTFDAVGPCYKTPTLTTGSFVTPACGAPAHATNLSIACIYNSSLVLSFTRGGGDRVIVVGRAGSAVNAAPAYNTSYTADPVFGNGSQIGTGNFVVYDGNDAGNVSVSISGLTGGVTYYFTVYEYLTPPPCYNTSSPPAISSATHGGRYLSSTTTQNTASVSPGALAQDVVKLTIVTTGDNVQSAFLNSITFTTTGTTNATNDLTNAKIYYTGSTNTFSNATQYGTTFTSFAGSLTATDLFALLPGNNYFWIAYDVKSSATNGNVLDATVTSFNLTDYSGTANYTPTPTAPAGNRPIASGGTCPIATPVAAACAFTGCITACCQGMTVLGGATFGTTWPSSWPCNAANNGNGYNDLTGTISFTVNEGSTYPFSFSFDDWIGLDFRWAVWIDWNANGDFRDAGERYPAGTATNDLWTSQSITVPTGVATSGIKMRLWIQSDLYPNACPYRTTCGIFSTSLGFIADVTINVPNASGGPPGSGSGTESCPTLQPGVTTAIYYNLNDVAVPLTASGSNHLWYTTASGGTGSATAPTPLTNTPGTTAYYVSQTNASGSPVCEGPRTQIAVIVHLPPLPLAPLTAVTQPDCNVGTGSVLLTGLPQPGNWTIQPGGIIGSGDSALIAPLPPGTYNYTVTNDLGCISAVSANAVINPQPATPSAPIVFSVTQPSGGVTTGTVVLTGLPADGWVVNPGGYVGAPGVTTLTISGLAPGTYTFTVTNAQGCTSAATTDINIGEPLPVELLSFTGTCENGIRTLSWSTASETGNQYFSLERSSDTRQWSVAAILPGAGNSLTIREYVYIDRESLSGEVYYRLKQTDYDGHFVISNVIVMKDCRSEQAGLIIFPNPNDGRFTLIIAEDQCGTCSVEVYNRIGKLVFEADAFQPFINLSALPEGVYFLHLNAASGKYIRKFVITHHD